MVRRFLLRVISEYSVDAVSSNRAFMRVVLKAHARNREGSVDPRITPVVSLRYFDEGTTAGVRMDLIFKL